MTLPTRNKTFSDHCKYVLSYELLYLYKDLCKFYTFLYLRLCSHSTDCKRLGFVKRNHRLNIGSSRLKCLKDVENDLRELEVKRESRKANNKKETASV
jgi:hypothetical protein